MPKPTPMRGSAPDPKHPLRYPLSASIKYDGIRCVMMGGDPKTRSMKEVANRYLRQLLKDTPAMFNKDFEFILGDPADPLCYNKTNSAVMSHEGEPHISFYIFDDVSQPDLPFSERKKLVENQEGYPPNAIIVEQHWIENQQQLDALYAKVTAEGHEGLILRSPDGPYVYSKATAKQQYMLKLKPHEDSEFKILGCYEAMENTNEAFINELGRTDRSTDAAGLVPKGTLGGFHAEDFHTGVQFNCAPGKLSHKERDETWAEWLANPGAVKSRIGKYRHFPVGAKDKPRHPRWIGWRDASDMDPTEDKED